MKKKQYLKPQNTLYSFTIESIIALSNTGGSEIDGNMPWGNEGANEEGSRVKHYIWNGW